MLIQELLKLHEAAKQAKMSKVEALAAVAEGEKPDAALAAFLTKLGNQAEKIVLKQILDDPDNYGLDYDVKTKDIREGANVWIQHISVFENGFEAELNADLDDIGGDSQNHEQVDFDVNGKPTKTTLNKALAVFDAQDDWKRTE